MKVVIAGGTGFLGNALAWAWAEESHDVRVLTRALPAGQAQHESGTGKPGITRIGWTPDGHAGSLARELDDASALDQPRGRIDRRRPLERRPQAGAARQPDPRDPVPGDRPGAGARPAAAPSSAAAASATTAIAAASRSSEASSAGDDFLAHLCVEWEAEAQRAASPALRLVLLRTGPRAREIGRRPAADDAAVPLLRRRPDRIGTPVHAVGAPARLDRDGALDRRHAGGARPGQRHRAASR